jgi:hypothetical protein
MRTNILLYAHEVSETGGVKRNFYSPLHGAGTIETINPQEGGTVASVDFHDRRDLLPQAVLDDPTAETMLLSQRTADLLDNGNAAKLTVKAINQAVKARRMEIGRQLMQDAADMDEVLVQRLLFDLDLREIKLAK